MCACTHNYTTRILSVSSGIVFKLPVNSSYNPCTPIHTHTGPLLCVSGMRVRVRRGGGGSARKNWPINHWASVAMSSATHLVRRARKVLPFGWARRSRCAQNRPDNIVHIANRL